MNANAGYLRCAINACTSNEIHARNEMEIYFDCYSRMTFEEMKIVCFFFGNRRELEIFFLAFVFLLLLWCVNLSTVLLHKN